MFAVSEREMDGDAFFAVVGDACKLTALQEEWVGRRCVFGANALPIHTLIDCLLRLAFRGSGLAKPRGVFVAKVVHIAGIDHEVAPKLLGLLRPIRLLGAFTSTEDGERGDPVFPACGGDKGVRHFR